MAYDIDAQGGVSFGGRVVPVPRTISPEAQAFLATPPWEEAPPATGEPIPMWAMREHVDQQMGALSQMAQQMFPVSVEEIQVAGVRVHLIKPLDMPPENQGKVLMNLHGGGFVLSSGALAEAIPIAAKAKVTVMAVDYRLAPENPFPAAVDDAVAVYKTMLDYHRPDQIGIYGSSAGGFITGQALMRLKQEGLPLPACAGVFTAGGALDNLGDTANIFTLMGFWGDLILPTDHKVSEIRAYLNGADAKDPAVSPIYGDVSHFPPTLLMSGTRDAVLSSASTFHRALRRADVDAELYVFDAMPHAHWYMLHLPEAQEALDIQAAFFLKHLK